MRFATIVSVIASFFACSISNAQSMLWVRQFGTNRPDWVRALAPDGAGGVFVGANTGGSLAGPNFGGQDVVLARFDDAGRRPWILQFGSNDDDKPRSLVPDTAGGVFASGTTKGSLAGPNAGRTDAWLARYDGAGARLWILQIGSDGDEVALLAPDGAGGVFIGGRTTGSLGGPNLGGENAWLARYDNSGNQAWIIQFGALSTAWTLAPDGTGGVFIGGHTAGSLGGPNQGGRDAWVARYDGSGNQLWITQLGSSEIDDITGLAPDRAGGVIAGGRTLGDLAGPNAGLSDAFLARYDSAGNRLWLRQFGSSGIDQTRALAPDGTGGVFLGGYTNGNLGGPRLGGKDNWVAHYDGAGGQDWITQFGSGVEDFLDALASDGAGGVYAGGTTCGDLGGRHRGQCDAYVARFTDDCYPDCDQSGTLDIFDFLCFQNSFVSGEPYACDCDTTTGPLVCDIFDFLCFQNAFVAGCP